MTGMLASVCSVDEATQALQGNADLIDCKDPTRGALGALDTETIRLIVEYVGGRRPVSATSGDIASGIHQLRRAISRIADCGVDYVKFGVFSEQQLRSQTAVIGELAQRHRLVAVCFIDRFDPLPLLSMLADAGCAGIMLDTADKHRGRLTEVWPLAKIRQFVQRVNARGLLCGLAGGLRRDDIPQLLPLRPGYLGFRGALCRGERHTAVDAQAIAAVRDAIHAHEAPHPRDNLAVNQL